MSPIALHCETTPGLRRHFDSNMHPCESSFSAEPRPQRLRELIAWFERTRPLLVTSNLTASRSIVNRPISILLRCVSGWFGFDSKCDQRRRPVDWRHARIRVSAGVIEGRTLPTSRMRWARCNAIDYATVAGERDPLPLSLFGGEDLGVDV
jgi:hypothetical protein